MTPRRAHEGSVRPGRPEYRRLAWAFAISLVLHLLFIGVYHAGNALGLWDAIQLARSVAHPLTAAEQQQQRAADREVPMVFVEIAPQSATPDAPEKPAFYSDRNSRAADTETDGQTEVPKIDGTQTDVVKAQDVPRLDADRLQPAAPPAEREQPAEKPKPESPKPPGEIALARSSVSLREEMGTAEQPRPRTIKEALLRQNRNQLVGEKMKQDGGHQRVRLEATFDAQATPLGAYDRTFIDAVQSRWHDLLDRLSFEGYRRGKVVVQFNLNYNGTITDVRVVEENVGTTLTLMCQKAVQDPAPFEKWSREMRLMLDRDYREIQFTFYYN